MQELGPWFATAILVELLKPKHGKNLLDQLDDVDDVRITAGEPFADAIRKTPRAYVPPSKVAKAADGTKDTKVGHRLFVHWHAVAHAPVWSASKSRRMWITAVPTKVYLMRASLITGLGKFYMLGTPVMAGTSGCGF